MNGDRAFPRTVAIVGALAMLWGTLSLVNGTAARAASNFEAIAAGEIGRTVVKYEPAIVTPELADPGSSSVQAILNSTGLSTAFASSAYPGTLAISVPGLIDGLSGGQTDLPDYPLIAQTSHPAAPDQSLNSGPVNMTSRSRADESLATVTDGVNKAEAHVRVDRATDTVIATTDVTTAGGDIGAVRINGVYSTATVTRIPDGEPHRESTFAIGSMSILGQDVQLTEDGLVIPGQTVGLGGVDPVNELLRQLAATGTSVEVVSPTETANGIISAGITITRTEDLGDNGIITTVTTYGRALAEVFNVPRPTIDLGGGIDFGGVLPDSSTGGTGGFTPPSSSGGISTPPTASNPTTTQPPVVDPGSSPGATIETILARGLVPDEIPNNRFYPVLAIAAGVLALVFSLFRKMGVRPTWNS